MQTPKSSEVLAFCHELSPGLAWSAWIPKRKEVPMKFKSSEWNVLGPNVWIHTSGMRLHKGGAIRVPSHLCKKEGDEIRFLKLSDHARLDRLQIIWGNKRRGLMAFAVEILAEQSIA